MPATRAMSRARRRPRATARLWRHPVALSAVLALVLLAVLRSLVVETTYVSSPSMQPLLQPGDRLVVNKLAASTPYRGEVVLFDGTTVFDADQSSSGTPGPLDRAARAIGSALGANPDETDYIKRVVGLPGDRVRCCTTGGLIQVDGVAVREPYVHRNDPPSAQPFDVRVPPGRVFVLGDHRTVSADSRAHLGDPGGGMVPISDIIGSVAWRYWPLRRSGALGSTGAFDRVNAHGRREPPAASGVAPRGPYPERVGEAAHQREG